MSCFREHVIEGRRGVFPGQKLETVFLTWKRMPFPLSRRVPPRRDAVHSGGYLEARHTVPTYRGRGGEPGGMAGRPSTGWETR